MDDVGQLKDLLRAFTQSSFTRYSVTGDGIRLVLRQRPRAERKAAAEVSKAPEGPLPGATDHDVGKVIQSPRVGHFYPTRDQHGELTVKEGDMIEEGQAFGLVESMNLKYELRSDKSGLVDRYLIEDGEAVEFGQPLILLK